MKITYLERNNILSTIILRQMKRTLICLFAFSSLFANPQLDDMGEITIKAVDSSLSGILSILADESGYNIVTGPNVNSSERITINLVDTPIDQAIDIPS